MASLIAVTNETKSSAVRTTKDGRSIRYSLQVIQQPERARACGSGAKSSADRRPVDPPPIVELRVFEGEQDITFAYNANFFLFATLENARTIAPGRAPAATPSFPVLTGTPVAGMAYLDRPSPAGYFIFPDLSVRHEGKYRLSFALYEELKEPKDMDPEDRSAVNAHPQAGVDAHVSHRLEVKSAPFIVFSAKKFPGLSESTALSRMVAEQGCRVRIRRDVRMRRRENKSNKDWDDFDEDAGYEGGRRTATPDTYTPQQGMPTPNPALDADNRPRSVSNASNGSFAPPRRQSMEEMQQPYQPSNSYQQMPPPQSATYPQVPQYNAGQPQYQSHFATPQPAAPLMQPPQTPYSHQPHQSHPPAHNYQSQSNMHMGQSYGYMNNQSYQQPHYEPPAPVRQEPAVEYAQPAPDYRRSSVAQTTQPYPGPSQMMPPYNSMDYGRSQSMSQPVQPLQSPNHIAPVSTPVSSHMSNGHALAPLRTVLANVAPEKLEPVSPSYQSPPNTLSAPMSATSEIAPHQNYLDSRAKYVTQPQAQPQHSIGQKRSYSSSFDTRHMTERLQQGARPDPGMYPHDGVYDPVSPDMEEPMDRAAMSYRRADGSHRSRRVPELGV
ncbi:velum formation- protein [Kalmusia sp. IMI 367209]|nr:velum formation- protein [Kalmusia sp. IMI 367209]